MLCNDGVSWSSSVEMLQIGKEADAGEVSTAPQTGAEAQPERSGVSTRQNPDGSYLRVTISY